MDEQELPPAFLRRRFLKAGALAGISTLMAKAGMANALQAREEAGQHLKKGSSMPLARIDLNKDAPPERIRIISEAIYRAMIEVAAAPEHDKFQVVTRHADDEIVYPEEGYLGLRYTRDLIIIQVIWVGGRSVEVKKKFYRQIADEIHEKANLRKEDIWINLVDDGREDWSFGNGEMQYAPK